MRDLRKILRVRSGKGESSRQLLISWDDSYFIIICDLLQRSERARYVSDSEELLHMHKSALYHIMRTWRHFIRYGRACVDPRLYIIPDFTRGL